MEEFRRIKKTNLKTKMTYAERLNKIASSLFNSEDEINEAVEFMMYYSDLSDDEITNMTDQELINYMMVGSM